MVFVNSPNVDRFGKLKKINDKGEFKPYKVFRLDIPVEGLFVLLQDVNEMLAQPLVKKWNGEYIAPLIDLHISANF